MVQPGVNRPISFLFQFIFANLILMTICRNVTFFLRTFIFEKVVFAVLQEKRLAIIFVERLVIIISRKT